MTNLKIEELSTLETLSLDELNQVVGGGGCGRRFRRFRRLKVRGSNGDITAGLPTGGTPTGGDLIIVADSGIDAQVSTGGLVINGNSSFNDAVDIFIDGVNMSDIPVG